MKPRRCLVWYPQAGRWYAVTRPPMSVELGQRVWLALWEENRERRGFAAGFGRDVGRVRGVLGLVRVLEGRLAGWRDTPIGGRG